MSWVTISDYRHPDGWLGPADPDERSRSYCQQLEQAQNQLEELAQQNALLQQQLAQLLGGQTPPQQ